MEKTVRRNIEELENKLMELNDEKLRMKSKRNHNRISVKKYYELYRENVKQIQNFRILWFRCMEWNKIPRYWQKKGCINCFYLNVLNLECPCQYWEGWPMNKKCGSYTTVQPRWLD